MIPLPLTEVEQKRMALCTDQALPLDQKIIELMATADPKITHLTIEVRFNDLEQFYNRNARHWETTVLLDAFLNMGREYTLKAGLEEQLVGWARHKKFKAYVDWKDEAVIIMNQFRQFADYEESISVKVRHEND